MANSSCVGCPHYRKVCGYGIVKDYYVCKKGYCAKANKNNFKSKKKGK